MCRLLRLQLHLHDRLAFLGNELGHVLLQSPQKVELDERFQIPQLAHVVLDRRARHQDGVLDTALAQVLAQLHLVVLDPVRRCASSAATFHLMRASCITLNLSTCRTRAPTSCHCSFSCAFSNLKTRTSGKSYHGVVSKRAGWSLDLPHLGRDTEVDAVQHPRNSSHQKVDVPMLRKISFL